MRVKPDIIALEATSASVLGTVFGDLDANDRRGMNERG